MRSDLRKELLRRRDRDQRVRAEVVARHGGLPQPSSDLDPKLVETLGRIDRENTEWLKRVVRESGWPLSSLVGEDGADCAWLLAQHADHDPEFQVECLTLLERAVAQGAARPAHLAYLTDRVMLQRRGLQRFGTQFRAGTEGPEPEPLEDPEHVEELRASMGLEPLAHYRKRFLQEP